ncbi:MAG: hypothetical protein R3B45_10840 [Bdellovibrionota bacterium]
MFKNGFIAMLGMIFYYLPGTISLLIGIYSGLFSLQFFGGLLIVIATIAIPGFMSHYCKKFDVHEIFNPLIALRRSFQGGKLYWKAWAIALTALMISFLGLFIIGIGFLFTSVWFWQVAGYSFSNVFAKNFNLLQ